MAQHRCDTPGCTDQAQGRKIFCLKCWTRIPINLQHSIRNGTEKGLGTLRAHPSREWLHSAHKYTQVR